jgi:hypothetical protein
MKVKRWMLWVLAGALGLGLALGGLSIALGSRSPYPRLVRNRDIIRVNNSKGLISSDQAIAIAENAEGAKTLSTATSVQVELSVQRPAPGTVQSGPASGTPFYTVVFDGICLTKDRIIGWPPRLKTNVPFPNGCYPVHEQGYVVIDARSGQVEGEGTG